MSFYKKIYDKLTKSRKILKEEWKTNPDIFRHRILPGHQGGTYIDTNCTYLTIREHIISHYLLWRINKNHGDYRSYKMMAGIDVPFSGHSEYTKQQISKSHQDIPLSKEHREKISIGQLGRVGGFNGKKHTEETIQKMKRAQKGRIITDDVKKKLSIVRKSNNAVYQTDEYRQKMSESKKGKNHSEETRRKMKEAWAKRKQNKI